MIYVRMTERTGDRRGWSPFIEIGLDAALRVTEWGPRAELAFAAGRAEALGRDIEGLVPVDGAGWRAMLVDDEATHVWPVVGDRRLFEWSHRCVYDAGGGVCGAVCHGREVTARAAAEAQQLLEAQLLTAIREHMNIALWAIDAQGTMLYQEGRASTPRPGALVGMNMLELFAHSPGLPLLRGAMAGQMGHNLQEEGGKSWETWMVPASRRAPDGAVMVAISLDITETTAGERELREKLAVIERQQLVIRAMSTPIVEVWDGVLTLPIIGMVDSVRAAEIMDSLLQAVVRARARFAVLDMTGVEVLDTSTAAHLIGMIRAIQLLGAEGIITGIHPNIARTMVMLGIDLSRITIHANLREALRYCIERMQAR
jgi:rsbT co-antagonist protein RsbR